MKSYEHCIIRKFPLKVPVEPLCYDISMKSYGFFMTLPSKLPRSSGGVPFAPTEPQSGGGLGGKRFQAPGRSRRRSKGFLVGKSSRNMRKLYENMGIMWENYGFSQEIYGNMGFSRLKIGGILNVTRNIRDDLEFH